MGGLKTIGPVESGLQGLWPSNPAPGQMSPLQRAMFPMAGPAGLEKTVRDVGAQLQQSWQGFQRDPESAAMNLALAFGGEGGAEGGPADLAPAGKMKLLKTYSGAGGRRWAQVQHPTGEITDVLVRGPKNEANAWGDTHPIEEGRRSFIYDKAREQLASKAPRGEPRPVAPPAPKIFNIDHTKTFSTGPDPAYSQSNHFATIPTKDAMNLPVIGQTQNIEGYGSMVVRDYKGEPVIARTVGGEPGKQVAGLHRLVTSPAVTHPATQGVLSSGAPGPTEEPALGPDQIASLRRLGYEADPQGNLTRKPEIAFTPQHHFVGPPEPIELQYPQAAARGEAPGQPGYLASLQGKEPGPPAGSHLSKQQWAKMTSGQQSEYNRIYSSVASKLGLTKGAPPAAGNVGGLPILKGAPTPKDFWSYQAASETPGPPPNISKADWESLSPGMRREIARSAPAQAPVEHVFNRPTRRSTTSGTRRAAAPAPAAPLARPKFTPEHEAELWNLYHTARGALGTDNPYERKKYAAKYFSKAHPEFSPTHAYLHLTGER